MLFLLFNKKHKTIFAACRCKDQTKTHMKSHNKE